jgi:hypothetical protein
VCVCERERERDWVKARVGAIYCVILCCGGDGTAMDPIEWRMVKSD